MSEEIIKTSNTSDNNLAPALSYIGNKTRIKFDGNCMQQDKITFTDGKTVSIYNVYELSLSAGGYNDYPVLENCRTIRKTDWIIFFSGLCYTI